MAQKKLFIGADHGGFDLKQQLVTELSQQTEYQVIDCGAFAYSDGDDYPIFAFAVAEKVQTGAADTKGILLCRSGGGVIIAANKVRGIRAVLVRSKEEAKHAIEHNHANIIAIAADWTEIQIAKEIIQLFLETVPSNEERHQRRIDQIADYEKDLVKNTD